MDRRYEDIKRIKGARWLLLWVMLTQFVCQIAVRAVVSFIPEPAEYIRYFSYLQLGIITLITFLVPITVYSVTFWRKTEREDAEEMRFNKFPKKALPFILIMAVSGQFVMALLNLPFSGGGAEELVPLTGGEVLAALAVIALLPGIFEEFWMRGIILSVYERRSTAVAVLFTTIMFALLHGSPAKLPGVLFLGFFAAVITIKTNSVYAAMVYHIMSNATSVLFGYVAANYNISDKIIWIGAAAMTVVFAAAFIGFVIILPKTKMNRCKGEGKLLLKNILSLPVILCFILIYLKLKFAV